MRTSTPAALSALAFAAATQAAEPVLPLSVDFAALRGTVTATHTTGCQHLPASDCTGSAQGLKYTSPGGFSIELVKTDDHMARTNFQFDRSVAGKLHFHAHTTEDLRIDSTTLRLKQNFQFSQTVQGQVGLYVGQVHGEARATALANATLDPFSFTIPAITHRGEVYRAAQTINVPGQTHTFYEKNSFDEGDSPYGGLTAGAGWAVPLGKIGQAHSALRFSGDLRAGADIMSGGLGAEILLMSSADTNAASRPGLDLLKTSGRYAVGLGVNVRKIFKDKLFEVQDEFAETRLRDPYNAHADALNSRMAAEIGDFNAERNTAIKTPIIPHITTDDALKFLKVYDTTTYLQTEVTLSGSYRLAPQATISGVIAVPIGAPPVGGRPKPRAEIAFSYDF